MTDVGKTLSALWDTPAGSPNQPQRNRDFITLMDAAMKEKVTGLYVTDEKGGADRRRVPAYFNRPAKENREVAYPYITVNLLAVERAGNREHRGHGISIPYAPLGYTAPLVNPDPDVPSGYLTSEMPIPYDFTWQIASFARFVEHDREIIFALMQNERLAPRFAYLNVAGTVRYLDLLDGPTNVDGYDESNKRIFRKTWTARATAEFFQENILTATLPTEIVVDYEHIPDGAALL